MKRIMLNRLKCRVLRIFWYIWRRGGNLLEPFYPILDNLDQIRLLGCEKYHLRYLSSFLTFLYLALDTIVVHLTIDYDIKNSYLFQHVIMSFMPENFRTRLDLITPICIVLVIFISENLIFDKNAHLSCVMFAPEGNPDSLCSFMEQKIDSKLSKSLKELWFKTKHKFEICEKIFEIQINTAYSFPMMIYEFYRIFYVTGYKTSIRVWVCLLLMLKFSHDFVLPIMISFYFIIINIFLNIKQRHMISSIEHFLKFKYFSNFDLVCKKILLHTKEINNFTKFYSKYMTAIIIAYCFLGCCALNGAINFPNVSPIVTFPWILFSVTFLIEIAIFAMTSSRTIFLNRIIFFKLQDLQMSLCNRQITPIRRNIVHLDLVNEYKTLLLTTSFRITTKTILDNKLWLFQISRYLIMIYFKVANKF